MADAYVRLLFCNTCLEVEQVPDYDGPPEYDHYLNYRVQQHHTDGRPHRGFLARCENKNEIIRAAIDEAAATRDPTAYPALGQQMYDLKQNYQAEAARCWKEHNRTLNCDEYRSDRKRLYADTRADRKAEGLSINKDDRPNAWLCDFCPYHSVVMQRQQAAKGEYNYNV